MPIFICKRRLSFQKKKEDQFIFSSGPLATRHSSIIAF
jgi:hypothetical protein